MKRITEMSLVLLIACQATPPAEPATTPDVETTEDAIRAPLPRSLKGTTPAGVFAANSDGTLRLDEGVRDRFDYYLSALGEDSIGNVKARIKADAFALPKKARTRVADLLSRYLQLRDSGHESDATLPERLTRVQQLRREILGAEAAAAFFAHDEAVDAVFAQIGDGQRTATDLEASLPDDVRDAREKSALPLTMFEREQTMGAARSVDVALIREQAFGAEARARLEALDVIRADRASRVDAFKRARTQLASSPDSAARIEDLFQRIFPSSEQARARIWVR